MFENFFKGREKKLYKLLEGVNPEDVRRLYKAFPELMQKVKKIAEKKYEEKMKEKNYEEASLIASKYNLGERTVREALMKDIFVDILEPEIILLHTSCSDKETAEAMYESAMKRGKFLLALEIAKTADLRKKFVEEAAKGIYKKCMLFGFYEYAAKIAKKYGLKGGEILAETLVELRKK